MIETVTGKVDKFVLALDNGQFLEFDDAATLYAQADEMDHARMASTADDPMAETTIIDYLTRIRRDDNGETEMDGGVNRRAKTGDLKERITCVNRCGGGLWVDPIPEIQKPNYDAGPCEKCSENDGRDGDMDFTNYDGSREREY
jgi:hypothetical protein